MDNTKPFDDLKFIKNKYGEDLSHICRELFPTILEQPGKLSEILTSTFSESRSIAKDYHLDSNFAHNFKTIIYDKFYHSNQNKINPTKSAVELFKEAGYTLYPECQTEADIQSFRHFYYRADGKKVVYELGTQPEKSLQPEELCTFNGNRLNSNRVWFAVKDGAENLKREDFNNPARQDEYGTSVLSIQFTRGKNSTLSIKNRYNHAVINPDATFSNDLDNIIPGLTEAMANDYYIDIDHENIQKYDLNNYVLASDGKYYRYNYEINNIYYCENNVIIDNFVPKQLDKFRYVLCDYFIIDKTKNCSVSLYDKRLKCDDFINHFENIENIKVSNEENSTNQFITFKVKDGYDIQIKINDKNQIISYTNPNIALCKDYFLMHSIYLSELNLPNLTKCGNYFLCNNKFLTDLNLPNLTYCGNGFFSDNESLTDLNLPILLQCGGYFFSNNESITNLNLPNLTQCGSDFLRNNKSLTELNLPNLKQCGFYFLNNNESIAHLNLPNLTQCDSDFLRNNKSLTELNLPNLTQCANGFLKLNESISALNLPNLTQCGECFLYFNESLTNLNLPNLEQCGHVFLLSNKSISKLNLPKLKQCGNGFLFNNNSITNLNLPNLEQCGESFFCYSESLTNLNLPKLEQCGAGFLNSCTTLQNINVPLLNRFMLDYLIRKNPNLQNQPS